MMLSESQERMLAILKPGREPEAYRIFEKWGLDAAVIGATTATPAASSSDTRARWSATCRSAPCPTMRRCTTGPGLSRASPLGSTPAAVPPPSDWREAVLKLMSCPDMASKRWLWGAVRPPRHGRHPRRQFDRRGRRRGARARDAQGAGRHLRRHAPLRLSRPVRGRQAGGGGQVWRKKLRQ